MVRRARRAVRARWQGVAVVFRGNQILRATNFQKPHALPILLLQGFGSTRRCLTTLEKRLRTDGFDVFSLRLGGWFGTLNTRGIDRLAHHVLQKVAALRQRAGWDRITIIGHSKGGLVGRYLVSCLGGEAHVHTLVTLGTPHQGLPIRQLARVTPLGLVVKSLRQMRPDSRLFRHLIAHPIPPSVRCISLSSRDDPIAPAAFCQLASDHPNGQVINIEIPGLSHSDYLMKGRVYEIIRRYIRSS